MFFGESGDFLAYLKTISGITDLVGEATAARIYWDEARQTKPAPYIVLTIGDGTSHRHLAGLSGIRQSLVHCYCYADLPSTAETLGEAVRLAFGDGKQRQQMGDHFVHSAYADIIDAGLSPAREGSDVRRWWRRVLVDLQHSEAKS